MSSFPSPPAESPEAAATIREAGGERLGPPAPGRSAPGPFPFEEGDEGEPLRFLGAWRGLLDAIGTGLQGGLARSAAARLTMRGGR